MYNGEGVPLGVQNFFLLREYMNQLQLDQVLNELKLLIDTAQTEAPIQAFLEENPYLVIGVNDAILSMLISQFPLGAEFRADFAFVSYDSAGTYLHLIEIERPTLHIFVDTDEFSQPFNHAVQQLQDWVLWCEMNQPYLQNVLEPLLQFGGSGHLTPICRLIAGRRAELKNTKRKRRYSAKVNKSPRGIEISTYDRFLSSLPLAAFLHWDYAGARKRNKMLVL
jgi:hypothetical protein